jgi:hypothetical protein
VAQVLLIVVLVSQAEVQASPLLATVLRVAVPALQVEVQALLQEERYSIQDHKTFLTLMYQLKRKRKDVTL